MDLTVRVTRDLSRVDPAAWDGLEHGPSPFLEHGFLRALEMSGSVGRGSGWQPYYILVEQGSADSAKPSPKPTPKPTLVGAVACFLKDHSYGEYIFDFGWARASMRAGLPYYPKLVVAAPVTPASGPRLLLQPQRPGAVSREAVVRLLLRAIRDLGDELDVSSIHFLFTTQTEHATLADAGFMPRATFQFHWHNREYPDFDAFLATMASRKRKQIRKERRRALAAVDGLEFVGGADLCAADIDAMDRFYRRTTFMHGGQDYLRPGFFHALCELLPNRVQFARVGRGGKTVAGALYLETPQALYGRYWGCEKDIDCLHFETAYYAGIERCIERNIPLFEAGAQGEHKLLRGFSPSRTYSSHWIRDDGLRRAVRRFVREEAMGIDSYMAQLGQFMPYKQGV